jgi:hypothetical protein
MVGKPLPRVEDLPIDEAVEKLEAELPERMRRARGGEGPGELGQGHEDLDRPARLGNLGARRGHLALVLSTVALIIVTANT